MTADLFFVRLFVYLFRQDNMSNEVQVLDQLSSLGIAMEPERAAKVTGACIVLEVKRLRRSHRKSNIDSSKIQKCRRVQLSGVSLHRTISLKLHKHIG